MGSGNQELERQIGDVNSRIRFMRQVAMETRTVRKITFVEHEAILTALCARDAEPAALLMDQHIGHTLDDVTRIVRETLIRRKSPRGYGTSAPSLLGSARTGRTVGGYGLRLDLPTL